MRIRVYPYQQLSASARALAHALGGKVLFTDERSHYRARADDVVINWGSTSAPLQFRSRFPGMFLNHPAAVATAANKLKFFEATSRWHSAEAREVIIPWTTDRDEAQGWVDDSMAVIVRHTLTGSGGQGIDLIGETTRNERVVPEAPLYTRYIKKQAEYRVHVSVSQHTESGGTANRADVFDVQQKRKRSGDDDVDYQIRSHDNGWVFCRDNVEVPECVTNAAELVVRELGLDFGAVDVIFNTHHARAYVLEVNTAPGLEGTTLDKYVEMIRARVRS